MSEPAVTERERTLLGSGPSAEASCLFLERDGILILLFIFLTPTMIFQMCVSLF